MILVDSSVWIDYLGDVRNPASDRLDNLLGRVALGVPDLVLTEVLQGIRSPSGFERTRQLMLTFPVVTVGGVEVAIRAAENYRTLRSLGVTIRKTVDTLIATRCLMDGHALLHSDRDFEPFVEHLGLRSATT